MTLVSRLRRAVRAFRDYPGKRETDGDVPGRLVVCGEPWGCGGSGVLHQGDTEPEPTTPNASEPRVR